jgi:hypothetical protein
MCKAVGSTGSAEGLHIAQPTSPRLPAKIFALMSTDKKFQHYFSLCSFIFRIKIWKI